MHLTEKMLYIYTRTVHYSTRMRASCEEHKVVFVSTISLSHSRPTEKKMYTIETLDQRLERSSSLLND
jgi:hypothetical protein